jgi:hypothetical protein
MSKYKELAKKTVKTAIVSAISVAVMIAVYIGISIYAESVAKQKQEVESKLSADKGLRDSLDNQMNKSGVAEKRFAEIQVQRTTVNYEANLDVLADVLRGAKQLYRFANLKIKPAESRATDKPDLANFNYDITVRSRMRLDFQATSDVHVFSFLEDLRASAPGMVRIDMLSIKRTADLSDASISQISSGTTPLLVDVKLEFTWIGIAPKDKKPDAGQPNPSKP